MATWCLLAIVVLGIGVRVRHYLAAPSFWYDEAYVLVNVFDKSYQELTGPLRCEQAAPPLFLWSLRALYTSVGGSEWAMRLPAFLASIASVLVLIPAARRIAGPTGWMWAVGFAALSQPAVFHAVCVKPYAGDLLAAAMILAAGSYVVPAEGRSPRWSWPLVYGLAAILPWWSYPSVFALGGLSLGLLVRAVQWRSWRMAFSAGALTCVWAASVLAVWCFVGRHQRSDYLSDYWRPFFLDTSSPLAGVAWIVQRLVKMGNYGTTGMGWPLLLLAVVGFVTLARRAAAIAAMIAGQFVLMFGANALHFYPLEDRLFFFALPGLWLLAATAVGDLIDRCQGRWRWAVRAVLLALLAPGLVRYGYWTTQVPSKVEFREAFEFVRAHEQPGDRWLVSHPEVHEVYFGKPSPCPRSPEPSRIWIIAARGSEPPNIRGHLIHETDIKTVRIWLCEPAP